MADGFLIEIMKGNKVDTKKRGNVFGRYLKQNIGILILFAICILIFTIVFSLYQLETEAIWYAAGLCSIVLMLVFIAGFVKCVYGHIKRKKLMENIILCYDQLPDAETLAEYDYQQMLRQLGELYRKQQTLYEQERQDSIDYYTTWVHQIKTPISVMQMQLQSEDTKEHRELAAELFRIEQYVEMVLCYIRLDSASNDFVFQEYDLDSIIKQAIRKYAPQFIRRRITLRYEPVDRKVLTDEKWLLFIIEQLLSNAVKYTNGGSVTISVSDEMVLSISDTGIGIAPEDIPRIFDKGYTGYNGRANKKATGLGLYLCKQAADKLKIDISARSEVSKGSTFYLNLYTEDLQVE